MVLLLGQGSKDSRTFTFLAGFCFPALNEQMMIGGDCALGGRGLSPMNQSQNSQVLLG